MSFSIGIVGLPNVGKSTLFKALTKKQIEIANYPFCTINPNVGVVTVPDERIEKLSHISKSEKIIPTVIEFFDIAGLVKDAHKGEGLGNKFLSHIREVKAIVHVVRGFTDNNIIHVSNKVDPESDKETINLELIFADLETINKRLREEERNAKGNDKEAMARVPVLKKLKEHLEKGKLANELDLTDEERETIKELNLLTAKPMITVINVDEDSPLLKSPSPQPSPHATAGQATSGEGEKEKIKNSSPLVGEERRGGNSLAPAGRGQGEGKAITEEAIPVCAKIEAELAELSEDEAKAYLQELGLQTSGLDKIIKKSYEILGLITFFTSGPKESRAWTVRRGAKAPEAAGVIHTDFEKGFIRAEIIACDDFIACAGEAGAKEKGKLRVEGKDYIIQDGDVAHFRFNV